MNCPHFVECSGCTYLNLEYSDYQKKQKDKLCKLLSLFSIDPIWHSAGEKSLRTRLDMTLMDGKLGLYDREYKKVISMPECQMMSPDLLAWYNDFSKSLPRIQKGSVRLRVGPNRSRGVWLDFANADIKSILDEQKWLLNLQKAAHVEMGQKKKSPVLIDGLLKLRESPLEVWFETYDQNLKAVPLSCHISSFTQPGFKTNFLLVQLLQNKLQKLKPKSAIEFGSGIGNFTLPLCEHAEQVAACEVDFASCTALENNLKGSPHAAKVTIMNQDFQNKPYVFEQKFDFALVDPPRSGLKNFLQSLLAAQPHYVVYISCFPESFYDDSLNLKNAGYQLEELHLVDQFTWSEHIELFSLWKGPHV